MLTLIFTVWSVASSQAVHFRGLTLPVPIRDTILTEGSGCCSVTACRLQNRGNFAVFTVNGFGAKRQTYGIELGSCGHKLEEKSVLE